MNADALGLDGRVDLNYYDTLIAVADDCPVSSAVVPVPKALRTWDAGDPR